MRNSWTDDRLDDLNGKVDELGHRIDRRFDAIDGRFESVDRRFERIDQRIDAQTKVMIYAVIAMTTAMVTGFAGVAAAIVAN